MTRPFTLPERPIDRLVELLTAIAGHKRWFQNWSMLRCAGLSLLTCEGDPDELAARLYDIALPLKSGAGLFSAMRTDMRFCPAATLLRQGFTVEQFRQTCDATRALFHEAGLPKGETQESLACLILMEEAEDDAPSREQVERVVAIFAEMRRHSRLLTGRDDYPAAALLSAQPGTPEELIGRANRIYEALRDLKFGRGNQLQLASHMLTTAPEPDEVLVERFRRLYEVFRDRGLFMGSGDYDEVATLSLLPCEAEAVVDRVLEDREALRERLQPRPSRQEGFSLATSTAFLALATDGAQGTSLSAMQLTQVISLLAAQQAAAVAMASAAAAGGAAS